MTDAAEDLGNPHEPRADDPTEFMLRISGPVLQAVLAALGELPAKFSRRALDDIEAQRDAAVLEARRKKAEQRTRPLDSH